MAGTAASVGLVAVVALAAVGFATAGAAAVAGQRLASAADAAALAAADTVSGAASGTPCDRAHEVAATFGARVEDCVLDVLVATVTVSLRFGVVSASATARAGPPP